MTVGHFLTIDPDECRRLLGDASVGRVSWVSSDGLQVLPVNYVLVDDSVVFRVAAGTILAELTTPAQVAFEVDDLDQATATGWSVLLRGRSSAYEGDPAAVASRAWAPGVRDVVVKIAPHSWSGRAVSAEE